MKSESRLKSRLTGKKRQSGSICFLGLLLLACTPAIPSACSVSPSPVSSRPNPTANPTANPAASSNPTDPSSQTLTRLAAGRDSGHCVGYCHLAFEITPQTMQLAETAHDLKDKYPDRKIAQPSEPAVWPKLVGLADIKAFVAMPERIGCPDCADGGAEWIEMQFGAQIKRVTFEPAKGLPEEASLLLELKNLYNQLHATGRFPVDGR